MFWDADTMNKAHYSPEIHYEVSNLLPRLKTSIYLNEEEMKLLHKLWVKRI